MKTTTRLKLLLTAIILPLVFAGCFSSNPTRDGNSERSGKGTGGHGTEGTGSRPTVDTGQQGSSGTTRGHRGTPDSPTGPSQTGTVGMPSPGSEAGAKSDRNSPSDIRVATAETSSTNGSGSDAGENDIGGSTLPGQPEVSVAEALEGANAAVDAAADAVSEAEATIERAREEADAGGSGDEETFDPWAAPGSKQGNESGKSTGGDSSDADQDSDEKSKGQVADDTENDSFDPFADYGDENEQANDQQKRQIPRSDSLQTADDAVAAARAALNRARRALIKAAGNGAATDTDAEAVQLAAAQAAMEAAAEAVIASAIAVMAASDAFADKNSDFADEDAEAAQDRMAESIAMVVAISERDMKNAAEALEATGELLGAAGSLIGLLGKTEKQREESDDEGQAGAERVASLEKQLDRSLSVFDDRMEVENRNVVATMPGEDSELAGLTLPEGVDKNSRNTKISRTQTANDGGAVRDEEIVNSDVKARYEAPAGMARTETEQIVIAEGRAQDDDIVARQLREAAMAETDPELREALWKEYKSYKESLESGEADANQ